MPDPVPGQGAAPAVAETHAASAPVVVGRKETDAFILRLIARHGSTENALMQLAGEQIKYRKRAQRAETAAADLQKKVPADGSVVLVGDEAKAYEAIKKSGLTLDKVPAALTSLKDLQSKDSTMSKESALTLAAGEKYKPKVLKKLLGDVPLQFKKVNVKTKDKDGKDTIEEQQHPYVVLKEGDKETLEALDTYLEREHADFMDVLKADDTETTPTNGTRESTNGATSGITVPRQTASSGSKTPPKNDMNTAVDRALANRYMTPSQRAKANEKST